METALAFIVLGLMIAFVIGILKPSTVRMPSRKKAALVYGVAAIVGLTAFGMVVEPVEDDVRPTEEVAIADATEPQDEPTVVEPVATGPTLTGPQRNAVRAANAYLQMSGFSRQGLIDQLSSPYGDQFDIADATVAVDNLDVDWNAQAARSAAEYLRMSGFSCQGMIDQLSSEHGSQYTATEAKEGATRAGAC